ncbi:WD40 repeat-like protein [Paxillus ammoniavirescens]|nr:WD40 repeat-like protein [Paxillus ammoniavirescens]
MSQPYNTARNASQNIRGLPNTLLKLHGHMNPIWSVAFLPSGKEVISGSADGNVRRWRVEDGCELGKLMWDKGAVLAVAASVDGRFIAMGGKAKNITICDATTYEKVIELEGHLDNIRSLDFSHDSASVVSGSVDKTVIVWSTVTGKSLLGPLKGHTSTVWRAQFSPNGDKIASCDGGDIRIWNSHSGDLVIRPIPVKAVSLAWTPDDQQLIAGCGDGSIKRIASSSGSLIAGWKAHTNLVHSIAVSPNGKFIASASPDNTVRLWAMTTSERIFPPLECDDRVYSVAISPDGSHLANGGRDSKVRIWSLKRMVSSSLLKHKHAPATSNLIAHPNGSSSTQSVDNSVQQSVLSSLEEHALEPPTPPKVITDGQRKDPGHSVSSAFVPFLIIFPPKLL